MREQVVVLLEVFSKDVSYGQLLVQHCFQTVLLQCSARVQCKEGVLTEDNSKQFAKPEDVFPPKLVCYGMNFIK